MSIGLRHWFCQLHLKFIAAQRHLLVVTDQGEERVKHEVVRQIEFGAARFLAWVNATMLHPPGAPVGQKKKKKRCDKIF